MTSIKNLSLAILLLLMLFSGGQGSGEIVVVKFDCQGETRSITNLLADSLAANLKALKIPVVPRSRWESILDKSGYRENDMNYNPPVLSRLVERLDARGAVYGQAYKKNGLLIMDTFYIESGEVKPVDINPMVGYTTEDILEMTWNLALIISRPDKVPPKVVKVEPSDSTIVRDEYAEFKLYFDEPMNPDSYGITGEPEDMFFTFGDVEYFPGEHCFKFNVHLYNGREYKFWVNGPGIKPFMDTTGNVARSYWWKVITK